MPTISLIFTIVQALISVFVSAGAKQYGSHSPLVVGLTMFVLGVALIVVLNTIFQLLVVETVITLVYFAGLRDGRKSPTPT